jgi:hypothetical protein
MSKFVKGTRVAETHGDLRHDSYPSYGVILSAVENDRNHFLVEWDNGKYASASDPKRITKVKASDLMLEVDCKAKMDQLDAEFSALEDKVRAKMQIAAGALAEAADLADENGEELIEMYEAVSPLMRAMDEAGWSTSSLSC